MMLMTHEQFEMVRAMVWERIEQCQKDSEWAMQNHCDELYNTIVETERQWRKIAAKLDNNDCDSL